MPSFQRSVAVLPFHSCRYRCARERNCWKRLSVDGVWTWSDQNADWLSAYGRTAKIGFDPICYGMAVTAQRQVETATAQRIFLRRQRNSYGAYGICVMATERWKLGIKHTFVPLILLTTVFYQSSVHITGQTKKCQPGYCHNNLVYCQPTFIVFGPWTLQDIWNFRIYS